MKTSGLRRTLCVVLVLCAADAAAQTGVAGIAPIDFARHVAVNEVSMSPSGDHVALAVSTPDGLETKLEIVPLDGSGKTQVLRFGTQEHVANVVWTTDEQFVVSRARTEPLRPQPYSNGQLMTSDIRGKNQDTLFGYVPESGMMAARRKDRGFAGVASVIDAEPGMLLVSFRCWDCGEEPGTVIYRVDSRTGNRQEFERASEPASFLFDQRGVPRIRITSDANDDPVLAWRQTPTAAWTPVPEAIAGYSIEGGRFDSDGNVLYTVVSDKGEPGQLYRIDLAGATRTRLTGRDDIDISRLVYAGRHGAPFAAIYDAAKPQVQYLDPTSEWAKLHAGLMKSFPAELLDFLEFSRDDNKILFSVWSDRHPPAYYVFDRKAKSAQLVSESMPWIKPGQMAARRSIDFTGGDGRRLQAFYTASGPGTRPLIVLPHGGPYGPFERWGFDRDAQFFASRGYGVLQVNFRGSGGRGTAFQTAGYREWGGKIQDDIADAVRWTIDNKLTDPQRICTFGASFGGYAALMQPIRFPDLYKCAVGYVGVYDLTVMHKAGDVPDSRSGRRYLARVLGTDQATLIANSPARNVDKIQVPVFLAQGSVDRRVPMEQFNALKNAFPSSVPVETMVAQGEGHGFYKDETQAELYRRVGVFLDRHIGAGAKSVQATP